MRRTTTRRTTRPTRRGTARETVGACRWALGSSTRAVGAGRGPPEGSLRAAEHGAGARGRGACTPIPALTREPAPWAGSGADCVVVGVALGVSVGVAGAWHGPGGAWHRPSGRDRGVADAERVWWAWRWAEPHCGPAPGLLCYVCQSLPGPESCQLRRRCGPRHHFCKTFVSHGDTGERPGRGPQAGPGCPSAQA